MQPTSGLALDDLTLFDLLCLLHVMTPTHNPALLFQCPHLPKSPSCASATPLQSQAGGILSYAMTGRALVGLCR